MPNLFLLKNTLPNLETSFRFDSLLFQEGRSIVENKTADIIQETRKLQIRRRGGTSEEQNQVVVGMYNPWKPPSMQSTQPQMMQTTQENQLKASRDVRWHCGFYS